MSHLYLANWGDKYFLTKNFPARRHLPTQQPRMPGQDHHREDNDDDHHHADVNQVDGAQKQLVGSLGAIERMLGIITEKLQVQIIQSRIFFRWPYSFQSRQPFVCGQWPYLHQSNIVTIEVAGGHLRRRDGDGLVDHVERDGRDSGQLRALPRRRRHVPFPQGTSSTSNLGCFLNHMHISHPRQLEPYVTNENL